MMEATGLLYCGSHGTAAEREFHKYHLEHSLIGIQDMTSRLVLADRTVLQCGLRRKAITVPMLA